MTFDPSLPISRNVRMTRAERKEAAQWARVWRSQARAGRLSNVTLALVRRMVFVRFA